MSEPSSNWILLHRNLLHNDLWKQEPFTRGQAWVDLLLCANWKDGITIVKGIKIPYRRGQLCRSMTQLSIRWQWSVGKVKRYLDMLSEIEQISYEFCSKNGTHDGTQKSSITTLITITNYNSYQIGGTDNGTQTERRRNADGTQTELVQEGKEGKEGKEEKLRGNSPPSKFTPPSLAEVSEYCSTRNNGVDAARWVNHYQSNGWKVGKNPMKDWRAAVRTWEKDQPKPGPLEQPAYMRGVR